MLSQNRRGWVSPRITVRLARLNRYLCFLLAKMGGYYAADRIISLHDTSYLTTSYFDHIVDIAKTTDPVWGEKSRYRLFLAVTLANYADSIGGAFVFAGVSWGHTARAVLEHTGTTNDVWLLDAWDGRRTTSDPSLKMGFATNLEEVRTGFTGYDNVHFIQGALPESLSDVPFGTISYVHICLGDPDTESKVLLKLYPDMAPGGVVLVDAYTRRSKRRPFFDDACTKLGATIIPLLSGHGLIFKR